MTGMRPVEPVGTETLADVAQLSSRTIPGAGEVSVTLPRGTGAHTAVSTGPVALTLDQWQCEHGQGPCLDALRGGGTVSVPAMSTERRWLALPGDVPREARHAVARHLRAAIARRALIEQAKGIIMADRRCTASEASEILHRLARYAGRKPSEIAADLVGRVERAKRG
jgi:hypothetical protein